MNGVSMPIFLWDKRRLSIKTRSKRRRLVKKIYSQSIFVQRTLLDWLKEFHHKEPFRNLNDMCADLRHKSLHLRQLFDPEEDLMKSYILIIGDRLNYIKSIIEEILTSPSVPPNSKNILDKLRFEEFMETVQLFKETLRWKGKIY